MLFVIVLEFFLCWTPLYVINTITLFDQNLVYKNLGYTAISFFQLLAYSSSCCNPITYCFMNSGFRKAFLNLFHCLKREPNRRMSVEFYNSCTIAGESSGILTTTLDSYNKSDCCSSTTLSNGRLGTENYCMYMRTTLHCSRNPIANHVTFESA